MKRETSNGQGIMLVITEKPSVAQTIATVLGAVDRNAGYLQGKDVIVSWCVGHLVELAPADQYDPSLSKWRFEDLPILPEPWKFIIPEDRQKQFHIIRQLMHDPRVSRIICATDAGREGELIFRLVYNQSGCRKPVQRLWISSMEDRAIREGFAQLRDDSQYENLYQAALCRAQADWIIGINATRLFSVLYRQTLNVGRVMTPTLAMIVNREAAIERFKSTPFYTVVLDAGAFQVSSDPFKDRVTAEQIRSACDGKTATVTRIEQIDKSEKPPRLYDLTTLQRDANRLLGFTAQQTLDYAQSLYEKKLITYPRTDSRYLTADLAEKAKELVKLSIALMPCLAAVKCDCHPGQVVDDHQVNDHHAMIPTMAITQTDLSALLAGERAILQLIAVRLVCATAEAYHFSETTITVDFGGQAFTSKVKSNTQPGWKAIDEAFNSSLKIKKEDPKPDSLPPPLQQGQCLTALIASIKEGKTSPPKHFTEDTLLAAMDTASADDMPENAARRGLGTPATRAGILEKLIKTGLVDRHGEKKAKHLLPTHKGIALITVLPEQLQSAQLTAAWEDRLKQVEQGNLAAENFIRDIKILIQDLVQTYQAVKDGQSLFIQNAKHKT
ncbi:MAG: DNA topoisomerase 3 [Eubacteriales bacterium]|nr:DNA topoisomerase 3 [Eubacteriales bacterium]